MVLLVPPAVAKIAQKLSEDVFFSFFFFFFFFLPSASLFTLPQPWLHATQSRASGWVRRGLDVTAESMWVPY